MKDHRPRFQRDRILGTNQVLLINTNPCTKQDLLALTSYLTSYLCVPTLFSSFFKFTTLLPGPNNDRLNRSMIFLPESNFKDGGNWKEDRNIRNHFFSLFISFFYVSELYKQTNKSSRKKQYLRHVNNFMKLCEHLYDRVINFT